MQTSIKEDKGGGQGWSCVYTHWPIGNQHAKPIGQSGFWVGISMAGCGVLPSITLLDTHLRRGVLHMRTSYLAQTYLLRETILHGVVQLASYWFLTSRHPIGSASGEETLTTLTWRAALHDLALALGAWSVAWSILSPDKSPYPALPARPVQRLAVAAVGLALLVGP